MKQTTNDLYPLVMEPSFRHGSETPWGGHALKDQFGKDTPDNETGESLEMSALPGHESRIANGVYKGKTLQDIFLLAGSRLTGQKESAFPLLLKLLDAREKLSVQVHPDDAYAMAHEKKTGKSEAWYILDAKPGAKLVYGIDTHGKDLKSVVENNELESCLCWVDAHPGDVFYIPSGTVHALGPGIQCYEIQQSSDVTYRFWDWGRVGADGKPRELHTRQAISVSKPDFRPGKKASGEDHQAGGTSALLVEDPHFRLFTVDLHGKYSLPAGKMLFLTATDACTISWDEQEQEIKPWQSVLIPAEMGKADIRGDCRILVSCAA